MKRLGCSRYILKLFIFVHFDLHRYSNGRGSSGQYVVGCRRIKYADQTQLLNSNEFLWKSNKNVSVSMNFNCLRAPLHYKSIGCLLK